MEAHFLGDPQQDADLAGLVARAGSRDQEDERCRPLLREKADLEPVVVPEEVGDLAVGEGAQGEFLEGNVLGQLGLELEWRADDRGDQRVLEGITVAGGQRTVRRPEEKRDEKDERCDMPLTAGNNLRQPSKPAPDG